MLYLLGLKNISDEDKKSKEGLGKKCDVLNFNIDHFSNSKQKMFEDYLTRFINILKVHVILLFNININYFDRKLTT